MALLQKELKNCLPFIPGLLFLLVLISYLSRQSYSHYIYGIELFYTSFPAIVCCLLYSNNDEIDLVISSKTKTYQCFGLKCFSVYITSFVTLLIFLFALCLMNKLPLSYALYCAFSFALTSLLFISVSGFLRLVLRNAYISVSFIAMIIIILYQFHDRLAKERMAEQYLYFDPYISALFDSVNQTWLMNKGITVFISAAFFASSYLLLKHDRLFNTSNS